MDSKGVDYDYVQSEGFGSVERLAKILANNGYRTIVIVGGDGALNDAINGIMLSDAEDKENIALGMIPNGIGNDFAKYWGLSTEYKPAVDCIINHRLKKIDVGTAISTMEKNTNAATSSMLLTSDWGHESLKSPIRPNASGG